MKKCASCTKDLPDAALHCVFCGAKQPPAPALQPGLAKTAFGYSANDLLDRQGRPMPPASGYAPTMPPSGYAPTMMNPPPQRSAPAAPQPPSGYAPTMMNPPPQHGPPPRPAPPSAPPPIFAPPAPQPPPYSPPPYSAPPYSPSPYSPSPYPPPPPAPSPPAGGNFVPASNAAAKTMFVQAAPLGPPAASPAFLQQPPPSPPAMAATLVPPPGPMHVAVPVPVRSPQSPMMAIPAAQPPPYYGSQTSRTIRPRDPWRDSLRAMMFLWGLAIIAAFCTPVLTSPSLVFNWRAILDGTGTDRLLPLTVAAVGFLSLVIPFIPMPTAVRGVIATLLGLAGIAMPMALGHLPEWQFLSLMGGTLILVPGLLIRNEYRDSILPRLLVTIGVLGILLPHLVPDHGTIPLVGLFKALIDVPGSAKVAFALQVGLITIVVISLLAWLPAPVTGGAKVWAWLIILWALVTHLAQLVLTGHIGDAISASPFAALAAWVIGGHGPGVIGSAYLVIVGYGLASALGKQLE